MANIFEGYAMKMPITYWCEEKNAAYALAKGFLSNNYLPYGRILNMRQISRIESE